MIDLHDKKVLARLHKAKKTSLNALVPFRQARKELIRDHVGSWYSENSGARMETLVNLINQTARIYTVALAANNPRVMVTTPLTENWPFAKRFEVNLNKLISDMNLDRTFRLCVLDAFFCVGCAVVMMRDTDTRFHGLTEAEEDVWLDPGEPWLNRVSLDSLILDMSAGEISKMRFCGHRYRADFEKVKEEPGYDKKVQKELTPTSKHSVDDADFAREIASGGMVDDDELKPMLWMEDIWIPENNSVATFAVDFEHLPPLIEREWTGSQSGPYKFLSLGLVPDNIIPVSPAMNLKPLHDLQNRLHRRMRDDSNAHRKVNIYPPGGEDDADTLRKAKRNDWIKMKDPKAVTQAVLGGVDPADQGFSLFVQEEYDRFAGNLRAMGGLGAQAGTLGQEEIVQGNVSRMEADMHLAVMGFAGECCYDLGKLMWNDESLRILSSAEAGNTGFYYDTSWEPGNRAGDFEDYDFRVEPYSMVYKTPKQKLEELFQVLQQIAPLWPMFQASGANLDAEAILDEVARLTDRPELRKFITFNSPASMLGGDENTVRQSPVTTRNTVRRNVPTGGTPEARNAIMQQVLGGASRPQVNGQQAAAIGRSPA